MLIVYLRSGRVLGNLTTKWQLKVKSDNDSPSCAITLKSSSFSTSCAIILISCYNYCYLVILVL